MENKKQWIDRWKYLQQYKLNKQELWALLKKQNVRIKLFIILLIFRFGLTGSIFFGVKSYRDVQNVKTMIQELNNNGSSISTDLNDTKVYKWSILTGRLIAITWDKCNITTEELSFEELSGLVWLDLAQNSDEEEESMERYIKRLNLKNNKCLMVLNCYGFGVEEIDVRGCPFLVMMNISGIKTHKLDVSHNKLLIDLRLTRSEVRKLNAKGLPFLMHLYCSDNELEELDLSNNFLLMKLTCTLNGNMEKLDMSNNILLKEIDCYGNGLKKLVLKKNIRLRKITCRYNKLKELDISGCRNLEVLWCCDNELTRIDTTKNQKLKELQCAQNQILEIDFSKNQKLNFFEVDSSTELIGTPNWLSISDDGELKRGERLVE